MMYVILQINIDNVKYPHLSTLIVSIKSEKIYKSINNKIIYILVLINERFNCICL